MSALLNQHLGKKLRLRRTSLGLTQTQVAQAINVTFQQIQKYEKGTNGVSSARLLQLSNFLKVQIKFFFEDYQDFSEKKQNDEKQSLNYTFLAKLLSELSFDENGIEKIAELATEINQNVENIGARRLHTVMEKLLEDISFTASDIGPAKIKIDTEYVEKNLGELIKSQDLSKFIL